MNYEQKYNEALERAKEIKSKILSSHLSTESCKAVSEYIDEIIPELKESEDERIRKRIKGLIYHNDALLDKDELLAWLEKQKEQKPVEWSEEDKRILKGIIGLIDHNQHYDVANKEMLEWLKSLRPQLKRDGGDDYNKGYIKGRADTLKEFDDMPSWKPSEDEERLINTAISFLKDFADKGYENAVECIDWLKSKLNGNPGK